jgi:membrane fusion protein, heavy metal efflux system
MGNNQTGRSTIRTGQILLGFLAGAALGGGLYSVVERGGLLRSEGHTVAAADGAHGHSGHAAAGGHSEGDAHASEAKHEGGHSSAGGARGAEPSCVDMSEEQARANGIEIATAAGGRLERTATFPGEIALNADKVSHIVPRIGGIVHSVSRNLGDVVKPGDLMAVLDSRELAEAKASCLAAHQRLSLADARLKSAEELHAKKLKSDLEFLTIQKAVAEAEIEARSAANRLRILGMTKKQIDALPSQPDGLSRYELRAPCAGTVIRKHCSLGEVLDCQSDAFMIADLTTVWAEITVYAADVGSVRPGQSVTLRADSLNLSATSTITYVAPVLNEATRAIHARAEIPNAKGQWRPGAFITASVVRESESVAMLIPTDAIQRLENRPVVFVYDKGEFQPRPVGVGRSSATHTEIVSGLKPGERLATKGSFLLKAELGKGQASHEH